MTVTQLYVQTHKPTSTQALAKHTLTETAHVTGTEATARQTRRHTAHR